MKWDEDKVVYLRPLGWDLTDDKGQPLRITRHVCRVIEAVAKGVAGTAPDAEIIDREAWTAKIQQDADAFRKRTHR